MQKEAKVSVKTEETSEIRFVINTYEDIFSDFDPRPYSLKGLSEDFLSAAKGSLTNKPIDKIDFIFLVQKKERKEKEKSKIVKRGSIFTGVGMILMLTATFLFFKFKNESLLASFFTILLEPASWFLFWEGLNQLIFESKKIEPNLDFYRKMSDASIKFNSV